jgi:hypothetical protein
MHLYDINRKSNDTEKKNNENKEKKIARANLIDSNTERGYTNLMVFVTKYR